MRWLASDDPDRARLMRLADALYAEFQAPEFRRLCPKGKPEAMGGLFSLLELAEAGCRVREGRLECPDVMPDGSVGYRSEWDAGIGRATIREVFPEHARWDFTGMGGAPEPEPAPVYTQERAPWE